MEFMNDEYFSWDVTYFLNGWLFNRIPLLKKLKWREIVSCRGLYGHLSDKNNPDMTDGLFAFPIASTRTMGKHLTWRRVWVLKTFSRYYV